MSLSALFGFGSLFLLAHDAGGAQLLLEALELVLVNLRELLVDPLLDATHLRDVVLEHVLHAVLERDRRARAPSARAGELHVHDAGLFVKAPATIVQVKVHTNTHS